MDIPAGDDESCRFGPTIAATMSDDQFDISKSAHGVRFGMTALLMLISLASDNSTAIGKDGGWDLESYNIQINIALDAPGGLSEHLAAELPRYLAERVEASLAPLWRCNVKIAAGGERAKLLAAIMAADPPPADFSKDKDKLLIALVSMAPDGLKLTTREFDRYVQRWGPPLTRTSRQTSYVPEQLFSLVYKSFSPLARIEIDPKDARKVTLKPRGAQLPRHAGSPPIAKPGDLFVPFLRRTTRGGELEKKDGIVPVLWTFVEAAAIEDNAIVGRFQSASRRPIMTRRQGRIEPVAIAIHTDPAPTTLRLHSRTAAEKPLVGYEVFAQRPGDEKLTRIGASDATGRITIPPGKAPLQFLFVKHGGQLFARVPVVSGEKQRIDIPLPDDDARLAAEASLAAVREDLVDVVARRNILISRARQKIEKKDYAAAQELLRSLNDLPGRQQFKITMDTTKRSVRSDDPLMQRRIDRLFDATDTLLTKFLDVKPINEVNDELREAQSKADAKKANSSAEKKS
jgi:hypothetical protein